MSSTARSALLERALAGSQPSPGPRRRRHQTHLERRAQLRNTESSTNQHLRRLNRRNLAGFMRVNADEGFIVDRIEWRTVEIIIK